MDKPIKIHIASFPTKYMLGNTRVIYKIPSRKYVGWKSLA